VALKNCLTVRLAESAAAIFSQAPLMLLSSFSQTLLKIFYKSTWILSLSQALLMVSYFSLIKELLPVHVDVN
jgi:hypothetical protein